MAVNKTVNKRTNSHGAMRNCIEYVLRQDKTSEQLAYVTGPYCHDEINYDLVYRTFLEEKKLWRNLKKSLTENYGKPSTKKYQEGRLKTIAGHFQNKKTEDAIDAITWNDLDLDRVFQSMDFTLSAAGEESLNTMLR